MSRAYWWIGEIRAKIIWTSLNILRSTNLILGFFVILSYAGLAWMWHTYILPQEKGIYSPFQNGLSLIRFLGIIVTLNILISVSSYRRDVSWRLIPLTFTLFILILSAIYLSTVIRIE